jgi:hypothetical protein
MKTTILNRVEEDALKNEEDGDEGNEETEEYEGGGRSFGGAGNVETEEVDMTDLPPELRMEDYDDDSVDDAEIENDEDPDNFAVGSTPHLD